MREDIPLTVSVVDMAVAKLADEVAQRKGDEENWHGDEDEIVQIVIKAIATGNHFDSAAEIAAAAAKVYDISYSRWYA